MTLHLPPPMLTNIYFVCISNVHHSDEGQVGVHCSVYTSLMPVSWNGSA